MSKLLPTIQERITRIQAEIKGVKHQYNITQWELDFMADLVKRDIAFGSTGQLKVIEQIERKVFSDDNGE